jgi:hypothetical protein
MMLDYLEEKLGPISDDLSKLTGYLREEESKPHAE